MDGSATIRLPSLPDTKVKDEDKEKEKEEAAKCASTTFGACSQASDEALMAQLGEGNREALAILFRRHARTVRSISSARVITSMVAAGFSTELACRPTASGSTARTVLSS
jgi:hypothetical protein